MNEVFDPYAPQDDWEADREAEMESLRQELNLQIAFNLKDTYLAIAKDQTSISMKNLRFFLGIEEEMTSSLERCVKWNSHNNSLKYLVFHLVYLLPNFLPCQ